MSVASSLERALMHELLATYRNLNATHFKDALRTPTLELVDSRSRLGRFVPSSRALELSRGLLFESPWGAVVEVLKHEMAHQYVFEVLGERHENPHGPAFREVCRRLGIDGRARGMPEVPTEDDPRGRVVEKIARLLALAESPNQHEAEAAALAAQKLMLKHNIDAARTRGAQDYAFLHIGAPKGRVTESERMVAMILGKHFFVEVIWVSAYRPLEGKRGSVLEICGTDENLAMAEYVHGFLTATADRLWESHKREARIQSNRERRTFLAGVMTGFSEKLAEQGVVHKKAGLVWVKDGNLVQYFRMRHPYVRHVRHAGERRTETYSHGKEAGRRIVLRRAFTSDASSRGRLLPERSG